MTAPFQPTAYERQCLERARQTLADHPETTDLAALAQQSDLSPYKLGAGFRAVYGCSPAAYLKTMRLERAGALLRNSHLPVKAIAAACGYADEKSFLRAFKKQTGMTPTAYRKA